MDLYEHSLDFFKSLCTPVHPRTLYGYVQDPARYKQDVTRKWVYISVKNMCGIHVFVNVLLHENKKNEKK